MNKLVQLAARFVEATAELDAIRDEMRKLLLNGVDPHPPRPTRAARSGAKKRPPRQQRPNAAGAAKAAEAARAAEARIVELVQATPGLRTAQLAKATGAWMTTASGRLERLQMRGLIERDADGGWQASAGTPPAGSTQVEPKANPPG